MKSKRQILPGGLRRSNFTIMAFLLALCCGVAGTDKATNHKYLIWWVFQWIDGDFNLAFHNTR